MSKWRSALAVMSLLLGLFPLAGCGPSLPQCADDALQPATLSTPQQWTIVDSLTPQLTWSYPDSSCRPKYFTIFLFPVHSHTPVNTIVLPGTSTAYTPASPLLPGQEYEWEVTSKNDSNIVQMSAMKEFFTGPLCDPASLKAPSLLIPLDGGQVDTLGPTMEWTYPENCLPQGYRVDISTDPTFSTLTLSRQLEIPRVIWYVDSALTDCGYYFWRVAATSGSTLGPYSSVSIFQVNREDECAPLASANLRGVLWYDQCPVALDANPVPNPLPDGCVVDSYGVDADGIYQFGEPYMGGIPVHLGPGDCPLTGAMAVTTGADGIFLFTGLTPGKYCLSVSAVNFVGRGDNGHWTLVPGGHEGTSYRSILLAPGENLGGQNFAWYEPSTSPTLVPTSTLTPTPVSSFDFIPSFNANCHSGPGLNYGVLDVAIMGQSYPLDGRNQDGDWVRLMLTPNLGCWVGTSTGSASADIARLRVLITPPTPTSTSAVSCASYTDEKSCEAQPACQWVQRLSAGPPTYICTNK